MKSLLLNLTLACIWLFLSSTPSLSSFFLGFLLGFILLVLFRPVFDSASYVRRCFGLVTFLVVFTREFVLANFMVARVVLFRSNESVHPNFITYDITGLKSFEILLLSYCISLTPGTTTVDISEDFNTLVFHALDADSPQDVRAHIDQTLRPAILKFTR
ncbi:MAG: Na+/H+ antiporter subunit E [Verrucomicrobia bacterium]|nr:Na+/H+ antiporter subunit E [Verrucomicrobiota bacterium]